MKINKYIVIAVVAVSLTFVGCEKEEEDNTPPTIENLEIGHDGKFQTGSELHVEFDVSDEGGLDYYQISIHPEGDHKSTSEEWEFEQKFTEISGLKNYSVHNHEIEVPLDAELGEYHIDLMVVDLAGNVTSKEIELELVESGVGEE